MNRHSLCARGAPLALLGLVLLLLAAGVAACSDPKATVIPTDTSKWDSDLRPVVDRLSSGDRTLAIAYLNRVKAQAAQTGQQIPAGVTLGQALDLERQYELDESRARAQGRAQQEQQDQQRKDAEQQAASVFSVSLLSKEVVPGEVSVGNRSDQAKFTFNFQNVGQKDITELVGTLTVSDSFFGTELRTIPLDYQETLPVGESRVWEASVPLSPAVTLDQRIRNTDLGQMKVVFTPKTIAFADGTHMDFAVAVAQP